MIKPVQRDLPEYISEKSDQADVRAGSPLLMGTQECGGGVNFAIFSRHATRVRLELFEHPEDSTPARVIDFDSTRNRTGDIWHVWIKGINSGQLYAYRVDGPYEPNEGHRFNFNRLLLDPFATAISHLPPWDFASALGYDPLSPGNDLNPSKRDNARTMPKCVFVNESFDWAGDEPPKHPWSKTVIYETHVRGFTIHPKAEVEHPGTYRGLMEKIPYLKTLGVTAVELMPLQEFNEASVTRRNPQTNEQLKNYWGYDSVVFFAP
jgi:isoamylase